jgi:hypothetical protein
MAYYSLRKCLFLKTYFITTKAVSFIFSRMSGRRFDIFEPNIFSVLPSIRTIAATVILRNVICRRTIFRCCIEHGERCVKKVMN